MITLIAVKNIKCNLLLRESPFWLPMVAHMRFTQLPPGNDIMLCTGHNIIPCPELRELRTWPDAQWGRIHTIPAKELRYALYTQQYIVISDKRCTQTQGPGYFCPSSYSSDF